MRFHHLCILLSLLCLALGGCSKEKGSDQKTKGTPGAGSFHQPVLDALTEAGLEPADFEQAAAKPYEAEACARGQVNKLDVLLCRYSDDATAKTGEKKLEQFVSGAVSGAIRRSGSVVLAVTDRKKVDLQGKQINKVIQIFVNGRKKGI